MGYFYGYFDESGHFKDRGQRHVALCGWVFVETPEGGGFAKEWKQKPGPVKQIHRRDWGPYEKLRHSKKKRLESLIPVIHKHAKYGCGVTVDCAAYRKFANGELKGRLEPDAWYLAFLFLLRHLAERKLTKDDYLELTFDWNRPSVRQNANRIFVDIMKKHPKLAEHMPKIGWAAKGVNAPVPIVYALYYVTRKAAGDTPEQLKEVAAKMRRLALPTTPEKK